MHKYMKTGVALIALTAGLVACTPAETIDPQELHESILTLDTHVDIPLTYMREIDPSGPTDLQVDFPKLTAGGLKAAFFIVYTPQGDLTDEGYSGGLKIAETRMSAIETMLSTHGDQIELAKTAADVRRINAAGKYVALVGV